MKEVARSRESDSLLWEVEVTIREHQNKPSVWQIEVMFDTDTIHFPPLTRGQVRLFCDAMRRAIVVGSVKVDPIDDECDDTL